MLCRLSRVSPASTRFMSSFSSSQRFLSRFLHHSALSSSPASSSSSPSLVDHRNYISRSSSRREPSPIRALMSLLTPDMISLGGGLPNPALFPYSELAIKLKDGTNIKLSDSELNECLQYSATPGLPALISSLVRLQEREHNPKLSSSHWSLAVTTGSQDALWKAFDMLLNEGDSILVDNPTYSGALAFLRPMNLNLMGVSTDEFGLIPSALEALMKENKGKTNKPKVLYTIVTGHNPSGATMTSERKREIYRIACEYDLIILEDDPYRYLEFGSSRAPMKGNEATFNRPKNESLFSMDTHGRVLRFDSLSKVLSSGIRLGFVTGPVAFINQINLTTQATNLHSSGISQMLALKLFQHWGDAGWDAHCNSVALFYARKRDFFMDCCEKYLQGLAEWSVPTAGMFAWIRLLGISDSKNFIEEKARKAKVILLPGQVFVPSNQASSYVRASYSTASEQQMEIAVQRLATLLKEEQIIQKGR
jgi:kynurenine/2-aminoadipate aminotransferase